MSRIDINSPYEELGYLETTGTQWIDIDLPIGNLSGYKMVFEMATASQLYGDNYRFMMLTNDSSRWVSIVPTSSTSYKLQIGGSGSEKSFQVDSVLNFHTITLDFIESYGQIDENKQNLSNSTTSLTGNISIFAQNKNGTYYPGARSKLKSVKIYQNGTLVRDLIPARLKASPTVMGLLDLADPDKTMYGNSGTGSFGYGLLVDAEINPNNSGTVTGTGAYAIGSNVTLTATANSGYEFEKWISRKYYLLTGLESTGTQYINTGLQATSNINFEICAKPLDLTTYDDYIIGTQSSGNSFYVNASRVCFSDYTNTTSITSPEDYNIYKLESNVFTVNNTSYNVRHDTSVSSSYPIILFGCNYSRLLLGKWILKYAKIYNNNTLIRNFIPVMDYTDLTFGLLDLVEMKFYKNNGSGDFRAYESGSGEYVSITDNPVTFTNISENILLTANFKSLSNCRYKVNGTWKNGTMYIKENGTWKSGTPKIKVNGAWKEGG